jgi:2-dehydro-3-deoxy-D-arabinonate dehydratase
MPDLGVRVVRVEHEGTSHACRVTPDGVLDVLDSDDALVALAGGGTIVARRPLAEARLLPPIVAPEIWCAGVTYERSRDARLEEAKSDAGDVYALVYEAERPELFLKDAGMRRTVGPDAPIGLRRDSLWTVPEPELAVVLGEGGELLAVTAGNDVSSRDIEGENPLYLPQAKIFASSCAIGPALVVPADWRSPFTIRMRIHGDGRQLYAGETTTASMRRSLRELAAWAVRDNPIPPGSVLLTGTGLVPPDEYTLEPGHVVEIEIDGVGVLRNPVGSAPARQPT